MGDVLDFPPQKDSRNRGKPYIRLVGDAESLEVSISPEKVLKLTPADQNFWRRWQAFTQQGVERRQFVYNIVCDWIRETNEGDLEAENAALICFYTPACKCLIEMKQKTAAWVAVRTLHRLYEEKMNGRNGADPLETSVTPEEMPKLSRAEKEICEAWELHQQYNKPHMGRVPVALEQWVFLHLALKVSEEKERLLYVLLENAKCYVLKQDISLNPYKLIKHLRQLQNEILGEELA